jgi:hypothetical protein
MKVSEAFPSRFLKAEDLRGKKVLVTIKYVEMEKIGEDVRPVVTFVNKDKQLTLNKTNSLMIAKLVGTEEMEDWGGKKIVLRPDVTTFGGKPIDCIRVEAMPSGGVPAAPEPPANDFDTSDDDDRVPVDLDD